MVTTLSISFSLGELLAGRQDASEVDPEGRLPLETATAAELLQNFADKGFTPSELVALSGAHTVCHLGFLFEQRDALSSWVCQPLLIRRTLQVSESFLACSWETRALATPLHLTTSTSRPCCSGRGRIRATAWPA